MYQMRRKNMIYQEQWSFHRRLLTFNRKKTNTTDKLSPLTSCRNPFCGSGKTKPFLPFLYNLQGADHPTKSKMETVKKIHDWGVVSNICCFHPIFGKNDPFFLPIYFSDGLVQPPTR